MNAAHQRRALDGSGDAQQTPDVSYPLVIEFNMNSKDGAWLAGVVAHACGVVTIDDTLGAAGTYGHCGAATTRAGSCRPSRWTRRGIDDRFGVATRPSSAQYTRNWMSGQMDGWMDAWMDGWTDGRTDGRMDGWTHGWIDGWMDGRMDGLMDGWDGCMDGRTLTWMVDGCG